MSDSKITEITGCTSVITCLTGWAVTTLPIVEWLAAFVAFVAGMITIISYIQRKFFKHKGSDSNV